MQYQDDESGSESERYQSKQIEDHVFQAAKALAGGQSANGVDPLDLALLFETSAPLVEQPWYTCAFSLVIFGNMCAIGIECDYGCLHCDLEERGFFILPDILFAVLFPADLIVKQMSYRSPEVAAIHGDTSKRTITPFYLVDLSIVLSRMAYLILTLQGIQYPPLKMVSMLRVWHLSSLASAFAKTGGKGLRNLWMIITGLGDTFKIVGWVCLFLLVIIWALACMLTVWVGQHEDLPHVLYDRYEGANSWQAIDYFGTVPRSCLTLLQVLTLDRWSTNVMWPVIRTFPWTAIVSIAFLCIGVLSLMSVIVGNIVERALMAAEKTAVEDQAAREKLDNTVLNSMKRLFVEADEAGNRNGCLSMDELKAMLKLSHVRDRLELLKLAPGEVELLFTLLATDGEIPVDQFFRGVSRMRGQAKASDLYQLQVDIQRNMACFKESETRVKEVNRSLEELLDLCDEADRDIIKGIDDHKDPVLQSRRNRIRQRRVEAKRVGVSVKEHVPAQKHHGVRRPSNIERKRCTLLAGEGIVNAEVKRRQAVEKELVAAKAERERILMDGMMTNNGR